MITLVFLLCLVVDICFILGGVPMSICVFFLLFGRGFRFDISVLVYFYSFLVLCFCIVYCVLAFGFLFRWCCDYLTPNVDIMRFRCEGGAKLPTKCFWCFWSEFLIFWSTLISCTLAISLYMSRSA